MQVKRKCCLPPFQKNTGEWVLQEKGINQEERGINQEIEPKTRNEAKGCPGRWATHPSLPGSAGARCGTLSCEPGPVPGSRGPGYQGGDPHPVEDLEQPGQTGRRECSSGGLEPHPGENTHTYVHVHMSVCVHVRLFPGDFGCFKETLLWGRVKISMLRGCCGRAIGVLRACCGTDAWP